MSITHTFVSTVPDGVDTSLVRPSDWNATHTVTDAGASGSRVCGLVGVNNSGTPDTQLDLSADLVQLRRISDGTTVVQTNTGTLTNNILTAGPAANGRDQAGAFSADSWLHFYCIWNGTTLATLSSTVAPPTGPTLPTGYTHWAYATAVFLDSGGALVGTTIRGATASYTAGGVVVVNAGTATTPTAVDLTSVIPPTALRMTLAVSGGCVTTGGGGVEHAVEIGYQGVSGSTASLLYTYGAAGAYGASTLIAHGFLLANVPNLAQEIVYHSDVDAGSSPVATIVIQSYALPNGDA